MKNQVFNKALASMVLIFALFGVSFAVLAQSQPTQDSISLQQVQWKSEQQVRDMLGEPISIKGPVGTHASYVLWQYSDVTIAFSNKRVFHLFRNDSLHKLVLD